MESLKVRTGSIGDARAISELHIAACHSVRVEPLETWVLSLTARFLMATYKNIPKRAVLRNRTKVNTITFA